MCMLLMYSRNMRVYCQWAAQRTLLRNSLHHPAPCPKMGSLMTCNEPLSPSLFMGEGFGVGVN